MEEGNKWARLEEESLFLNALRRNSLYNGPTTRVSIKLRNMKDGKYEGDRVGTRLLVTMMADDGIDTQSSENINHCYWG